MFKIIKWHRAKNNAGYVIDVAFKNDGTGEWKNDKVYVPCASAYAGKNKDEYPCALGAVNDAGELVIKCYRYDDYFEGWEDKKKKKPEKKQPEKKKPPIDDDEGCPF